MLRCTRCSPRCCLGQVCSMQALCTVHAAWIWRCKLSLRHFLLLLFFLLLFFFCLFFLFFLLLFLILRGLKIAGNPRSLGALSFLLSLSIFVCLSFVISLFVGARGGPPRQGAPRSRISRNNTACKTWLVSLSLCLSHSQQVGARDVPANGPELSSVLPGNIKLEVTWNGGTWRNGPM